MLNISDRLLSLGAKRNVPLSELTSFKIGGVSAFVLEPLCYSDLADALALCASARFPVCLLGKGTNILAADSGFSGLVIRFSHPTHPPVWEGTCVTACAGMSLTQLVRESVDHGLAGMENLCGIPGTVGGACAMNAGAYGTEISQILTGVRILQNGMDTWVRVEPEQMGYRTSPFSYPGCIILEASFSLRADDGSAIERMREVTAKRKEKQPLELPSGGSVFKRPAGAYAGMLIEQCGLKGRRIGGAQVSEKHAGFIVNTGGATEKDVSELIAMIRQTVQERTGYSLECEIKRMGDNICIF